MRCRSATCQAAVPQTTAPKCRRRPERCSAPSLAPLQAQTQTAPPPSTIWDHNGSVMYLVANGPSREFYYQKPRPGMLDAGARPDSLLFRGQVNDGLFLGTAYVFNP